MATDVRCAENMASLSEVKGSEVKFSSRRLWTVRCAEDVDSYGDRGAPRRHENCPVPRDQTS